MAGSATDLLEELKVLRKGRGLQASRLNDRVGPSLRATCGIGAADGEEAIRRRLAERLGGLLESLPEDLRLAVVVALALHPDARHPFLGERVQWLAEQLRRDGRTARRRMDDGLARLAQAAAGPAPALEEPSGHTDDGYYVKDFHALLRLDSATPEAIERRGIVAERDGIDHIDALITLPRDPTDRTGSHDLLMEVLYGATLVSKERDTASRFRFGLRLPTPLRTGERHEYGVLFRVPRDQLMRTHYVFTPSRRCRYFDLRIRFPAERRPRQIWRVSEAFPRDLDEPTPAMTGLTLDAAGELHLDFRDLRPGFGYGARWTDLPTYELQPGSPVPPRW